MDADSELTRAQFEELVIERLLGVPARVLDLRRRVPALFAARGWDADPDQVAVAVSAIACVKIGALGQVWRRPDKAAWKDKWALLGDLPTAEDIVRVLGLESLLEPVQ